MKKQFHNQLQAAVHYVESHLAAFSIGLIVVLGAAGLFYIWQNQAPFRDQALKGLVVSNVQIIHSSDAVASCFTQEIKTQLAAAGATLDTDNPAGIIIYGRATNYGLGHEVTVTAFWYSERAVFTVRDSDPDGTDNLATNARHISAGLTCELSRWYEAYRASRQPSRQVNGTKSL